LTRRDEKSAQASSPADTCATPHVRFMPYTIGATGIALVLVVYHFLTRRNFSTVIEVCEKPFCDFIEYYYPMGEAIFRTELPVPGFLYSPFIAILLAIFPPLGLSVSLVLWCILQVLLVVVCLLLFRRLVPAGLPVQLLFVALTLSSFPLRLNFIGGQVSVFMMAALLGLLVLHQRGHRAVAATLLALGVSFKFYPIFFLAPFIVRRDLRFLLVAVAACGAVLFIIPCIFLGVGDTVRFYDALLDAFRESDWVVANVHSQFFPHVVLRLAAAKGHDLHAQLPLLRWIAFGVAATNLGLLFLVQRARLRHADLWSFQLLALTIPFVLKTSWPHDFFLLSIAQTLLAWWLLGGEEADPATARAGQRRHASKVVTFSLLLPSIVFSNIIFFNLFGDFVGYGSWSFLFWANLLLLIASYVVLLPPALRRLRGMDKTNEFARECRTT